MLATLATLVIGIHVLHAAKFIDAPQPNFSGGGAALFLTNATRIVVYK